MDSFADYAAIFDVFVFDVSDRIFPEMGSVYVLCKSDFMAAHTIAAELRGISND